MNVVFTTGNQELDEKFVLEDSDIHHIKRVMRCKDNGKIESVDLENSSLTVLIDLFGQETSVEVELADGSYCSFFVFDEEVRSTLSALNEENMPEISFIQGGYSENDFIQSL